MPAAPHKAESPKEIISKEKRHNNVIILASLT